MPRFQFGRRGGPLAGALILGVAFVLLGGFLAAMGYDGYRDGKETESWTATSGRVLSATVEEKTRTVREDRRTRTETNYWPRVRYEYTVAGTTYTGDHIKADDFGGGYGRAHDILDRYPVGEATTVYVDPEHPDRAVLEPGAEMGNVYLLGGAATLFGSIGIGVLGLFVRFVRRLHRGGI